MPNLPCGGVGKGLSVSEQLVGTLRAASGRHIPFAIFADAARCVPTILCLIFHMQFYSLFFVAKYALYGVFGAEHRQKSVKY